MELALGKKKILTEALKKNTKSTWMVGIILLHFCEEKLQFRAQNNSRSTIGRKASRDESIIICNYYMAGITSGEMVDCDWLRSTFRGPLCKNKRVHFKTKQQN